MKINRNRRSLSKAAKLEKNFQGIIAKRSCGRKYTKSWLENVELAQPYLVASEDPDCCDGAYCFSADTGGSNSHGGSNGTDVWLEVSGILTNPGCAINCGTILWLNITFGGSCACGSFDNRSNPATACVWVDSYGDVQFCWEGLNLQYDGSLNGIGGNMDYDGVLSKIFITADFFGGVTCGGHATTSVTLNIGPC